MPDGWKEGLRMNKILPPRKGYQSQGYANEQSFGSDFGYQDGPSPESAALWDDGGHIDDDQNQRHFSSPSRKNTQHRGHLTQGITQHGRGFGREIGKDLEDQHPHPEGMEGFNDEDGQKLNDRWSFDISKQCSMKTSNKT